MSLAIPVNSTKSFLLTQKTPVDRRHILTISLEDYYQGAAFRKVLARGTWSRFDKRVEQNTQRTLEMLALLDAKATFFVSTWLAERMPGVIQAVAAQGHEVASAGVTSRSFRDLSEVELREEARVSREILEQLTGTRIRGYRVADHRLQPKDLWGLRVLAEEGYDYDSSLSPNLRLFHNRPDCRLMYQAMTTGLKFWELPLPSIDIAGLDIPIAGGNYLRQMPEPLMRRAVRSWMRTNQAPFIFYFRIWDLDPDQPEITGAPLLSRVRHYRNADKMPAMLRRSFEGLRLVSASEYLGLAPETRAVTKSAPAQSALLTAMSSSLAIRHLPLMMEGGSSLVPQGVTIVVPCFNEAESLSYLANALQQLKATVGNKYHLRFVFVDDGSSDHTWAIMQSLFGQDADAQVVRHARNQGVAAAILTGIRASLTEVVCSIDCDCTYDPLDLDEMMLLLRRDVDCVTASPYHPAGHVLNVPPWRLVVSAVASRCYRIVLGSKLHTFTSCFRLYRRSKLLELTVRETGFVGIAEILGRLHLQGGSIVEYPTTLTFRMFGRSKMKLIRNTALHLRLLSRLGTTRVAAAMGRRSWRVPADAEGVESLNVPGRALLSLDETEASRASQQTALPLQTRRSD